MEQKITTRIKGTYYYGADSAYQKQWLCPGAPITLVREPDNPHDSNAVSVWLSNQNIKLGHISRELAQKYSALIASKNIIRVCVDSVSRDDYGIKLFVQISYETENEGSLQYSRGSRFDRSINSLPSVQGVYGIVNIKNGRVYIGSSENIKNRGKRHSQELRAGTHKNSPMQSDFNQHGAENFEMRWLVHDIPVFQLAEMEERTIAAERRAGKNLYNLTDDGQGRKLREKYNYPASEDKKIQDNNLSMMRNHHSKSNSNETPNDSSVSSVVLVLGWLFGALLFFSLVILPQLLQ